jgi:hypothetical protein
LSWSFSTTEVPINNRLLDPCVLLGQQQQDLRGKFSIAVKPEIQSDLMQRVGTSGANRITTWTDGADLKRFAVLQGSQLAVARASKDDTTIRVYYQGSDDEIHEVLYRSNRGTWDPTPAKFPKALPGSGISAVSAKPAGEIRLYYQGRNKELAEHFMASNGRWAPSE